MLRLPPAASAGMVSVRATEWLGDFGWHQPPGPGADLEREKGWLSESALPGPLGSLMMKSLCHSSISLSFSSSLAGKLFWWQESNSKDPVRPFRWISFCFKSRCERRGKRFYCPAVKLSKILLRQARLRKAWNRVGGKASYPPPPRVPRRKPAQWESHLLTSLRTPCKAVWDS